MDLLVLTFVFYLRPTILARRAEKLRKETGDSRWWAALESEELPFAVKVKAILGRPFILLLTEPMLTAVTLYMSVSHLPHHRYPDDRLRLFLSLFMA